jgi:hypothetical protein
MPRHTLSSACTHTLVRSVRGVERLVRALAFWTATLLPLGYLPLLFAVPSRFATLPVVGKLLAINIFALLVGHSYGTDGDDEE